MLRFIIYSLLLLPVSSYAQDWKTFSDPSILFTAKYPADWVNKIKDGKRVFFTSPAENENDSFLENINISVTIHPDYGTKLKIKEIVQEIVDKVKESFTEFAEESRTSLKWNDVDAFEVIYSGKSKSDGITTVRITQRFCFYKTRLYLSTYTALKNRDIHAGTAKQIVNSIKFKP